MIAKSHQWQLTSVVVATLLGLWGSNAAALSLGRISVHSTLGEPLKAEIDILDINADESATLATKVAAPESFRTAGLEYNPALTSLQATLQRRPDGRAYIRLSSDRIINDPFVDMILEVSWNSGRIVRDYTLLFDPPDLRAARVTPPVPAQVPRSATEQAKPMPLQSDSKPPLAARELPPVAPARPASPVTKAPAAEPLRAVSQPGQPVGQTVTVKAGDTAGRIAAANKLATVSLDQMLVAMLRANPDAFIGDNVNRIKAGSVLALPNQSQASATPPEEARKTILAQSQDFNDFRRKFASSVPTAQPTLTGRNLSGKVQATVEDKKPVAVTPDKLMLSKGAIQGKSSEDQLAQARNAKDAASRSAELSKNISDLNKLAAASGTAAAASAASAASATTSTLPAIVAAPVASASLPASAPLTAAVPASAASQSASTPPNAVVSAPKKPALVKPPVPEPLPEPGLIDTLLENPLLPAGAVGLIALLAGLGLYKVRQRKKAAQPDSSFIESKARSDSLSSASGGQSVDTSDNLTTGSSMVYSPSQLDAVDDVDPVAEADVYLAYGRDLQAEEILKDALRSNPERLAIHQKLLEIYAKRRDAKAFEAIAALAFNLTDGTGADWEQICEKGLSIDPDNALYLPGGQPYANQVPPTLPAAAGVAATALTADQPSAPEAPSNGPMEMDLDLDFSLEEPAQAAAPAPEPAVNQTDPNALEFTTAADEAPEPLPSISLDFLPEAKAVPPEPDDRPPSVMGDLDFSVPEPEPDPAPVPTEPDTEAAPPPAAFANDLMSFDLDSLSLDLGDETPTDVNASIDETQDPLETKLALADEFKAIGDDDGARALIEEVLAEATGEIKAKAQSALSKL